jgi:hypothetical protein
VRLDGICGLAALFVVLNHIFLHAWPGFPVDHAPLRAARRRANAATASSRSSDTADGLSLRHAIHLT